MWMNIKIEEKQLTEALLEMLVAFSEAWEQEQSCWGYRKNDRADIEGNRIFLAQEDGQTIGYLFGHMEKARNMRSIMPADTPYFEMEELYIIPEKRSQGVGGALFRYAEDVLRNEKIEYLMLSTATKNHRAILHFYIDEMGMDFWSARLFKKL